MTRRMNMIYHGGLCCGIKTIHKFPDSPNSTLEEVKATDGQGLSVYESGRRPECRPTVMPAETALERLDRLIAHKDKNWPYGVIEAVLVSTTGAANAGKPDSQVAVWGPILEERGFECVTQCYNSNSWNTIFIYHRVVDKPKPAPVPAAEKPLR
jgi:hypothetical protein